MIESPPSEEPESPSMRANHPIPGSGLVSAFPKSSGHGQIAHQIEQLGLFEQSVMFKFRRRDSSVGYQEVVTSWPVLGTASAFLSLYLTSSWRRYVSRLSLAHFTSPHFFHLAKYIKRATGTVTDLLYLNPAQSSGGAVGYRYYFRKVMPFVRNLHGVVAISQRTSQQLLSAFPDAKVTVIHPWADERFRPRDKSASRALLDLPSDRILLLSVGIDVPRKNLDILGPVLNSLGSSYALVRIGPSARIRRRFGPDQLIERSGVPEEKMPHYYNAADAVLMPSFDEGFGLPVMEAVNSDVPVIASRIPVFEELLGGEYPLLANPIDPAEWVEKIRATRENYSDASERAGLYRSLKGRYTLARGAREFHAFFRSVGAL